MPETQTQTPENSSQEALQALQQRTQQQAQQKLGSTIQPDETPVVEPSNLVPQSVKKVAGEAADTVNKKVLEPFRQGLDNMGSDLQHAAEVGHTASGGQLNPVTRGLAGAVGTAMKMTPVGKDIPETAAMMIAPPELSEEEALALKGGPFEGMQVREVPTHAYRARPVGQEGVTAGERPVATSSLDKANTYAKNLEKMTGEKHEVVQIPLEGTDHIKHTGPDEGETWFSFKKSIPEEKLNKSGATKSLQSEQAAPKDVIESQGLKYKGELTKDSGVHMFEHPDHPDFTASLNEKDITPEKVRAKMDSKLKEFGVSGKEPSQPMAAEEKKELQDWFGKPLKSEADFNLARKQKAEWESNQALAKGKVNTAAKDILASKGPKVKPISFGKDKEPKNESKIVIEGVDEPKREGKYSDKVRIDPFKPGYGKNRGAKQVRSA